MSNWPEPTLEDNMKKVFISCLLILSASVLSAETFKESVFQEAVSAFEARDYQASLEKFISLENEGIKNADLYYNIGNCFFRLEQKGPAILYYKKALKLDSRHQGAQRNLEYVLSLTQDKLMSTEPDLLAALWQKMLSSLSLDFLAVIILFLIIGLILTINIMIWRYRGRDKSVPVFITTLILIFLAVMIFLTSIKWQQYSAEEEGVLLAASAIGYSGPSEDYTRVFTIHEGVVFEIERSEDDWSLIKLPNGLGGWIRKDAYALVAL